MMNIFQSVGILGGIFLYMTMLTKTEVWKLVFASLVIQFTLTGL
jgi:hypothetical protein